MPNMKGITVRIDAGLHAEIKAYLEEHEMTMGEFIALAALDELHPRSMGLDPELQAEVMAHLEGSETSLDGFITQAVQNELHPKTPELEENSMYRENMRTLAFQVPESLFQRVKQYLERNNMTQKAFVLGLIEDELDRDEELLRKQQEEAKTAEEEEQDEGISEGGEAPVSEEPLEVEVGDEPEEAPAVGDFEGSFDEAAEEEPGRDSIEDEPEYDEDTEPDEMDAPDESPGYGDDMDAEPAPAAEDTLGLDNGAVFAEVEGGSFPEQSEQENTPDAAQDDAPPDREWRVLACHSYYCQGTKAIAVYGAQGIAGFEESRTVRHGAALPSKGRQKQFAFSTEEDMTENTCRQGGTILSRWQVPPVMVAGVGNYPIEEWNTAERIGKLTR